jgi:hypothetical protein
MQRISLDSDKGLLVFPGNPLPNKTKDPLGFCCPVRSFNGQKATGELQNAILQNPMVLVNSVYMDG